MTVAKSILADLEDGEWVCGASWYASYRPTFAQRISELRADGTNIESRICKDHNHKGGIHAYRLVRKPEQLSLIA